MNLIVITGPTGVGKTDLTLEIAEHFGTDIINADSRQIYAEIPIGTAAPTREQQNRVKHHFVGTKHIGEYYSASLYEQEVIQLLRSEGPETRILSGGSMMYIDAVCNGIDDIPTIRDDIRIMMKKRLAEEGLEALVAELKTLDPEHWEIVDKQNPRRVVHALEICHQTGTTYTSFRKRNVKDGNDDGNRILPDGTRINITRIGITRDREEIYERINARVMDMVRKGLIDEAQRMLKYRNENALNTVGYKEMFKYFDGEISLEEALRQIQSHTREYARKQLTWYKRDPRMKWFNLSDRTITTNRIIEEINCHI